MPDTPPSGDLDEAAAKVRSVAFYLPQFHPIPENDEWWGPGFTEWQNVAAARPRFPGHYQPHIPADLGFYDLRLAESRAAQASLARQYGLHGFCYWHYWFNGHQLLERPIAETLRSGLPDFPFMLAWANENWTRTWDGQDNEVLIAQHYSPEDDAEHIRALAASFRDPRYIRIDGKPVFLIYRAGLLPDVASTLRTWRRVAAEIGLPGLYLGRVDTMESYDQSPEQQGFDAGVQFVPDWDRLGAPIPPTRAARWKGKVSRTAPAYANDRVHEYRDLAPDALSDSRGYFRYPCVTPGFDNSPRRRTRARIFKNSTPELYEEWLRRCVQGFQPRSAQENLVFINAWNEWAEGNHLEPDLKWGRGYLEATKRALLA